MFKKTNFEKFLLIINKYNFILLFLFIFVIICLICYIFSLNMQIKNNQEIIKDKLDLINNYIEKEKSLEEKIKIFEEEKKLLEEKKNNISLLDLEIDSSLTKFVSAKKSFSDLKYVPSDLEYIWWIYILDSKWSQKLRKQAKEALNKMWEDFYKLFNKKIVIISAYRSYNYQASIKAGGCSDIFCAKAWYSEHQSWLAFDIWEASSKEEFLSNINYAKYFEWFKNNAYLYWFHNTYQKWLEIDTYVEEPWHWRYVWIELATYLYNNNQTFAEFYNSKKW